MMNWARIESTTIILFDFLDNVPNLILVACSYTNGGAHYCKQGKGPHRVYINPYATQGYTTDTCCCTRKAYAILDDE